MKKLLTLAAAFTATFASVNANAAQIIQTNTFTAAPNGTSATATVNQFDTSLGILDSITLLFSSNLSVSGTLSNGSGASHNYSLTPGGSASASAGGFNIFETLSGSSSPLTVDGKKSQNFSNLTASAGGVSQELTSGFAPFQGVGSVDLSFNNISRSLTFSPTANSSLSNLNWLFGGSYTLTYNYTEASTPAVPEPATWGMMLLGFGMIGFAARHRRRQKIQVKFA